MNKKIILLADKLRMKASIKHPTDLISEAINEGLEISKNDIIEIFTTSKLGHEFYTPDSIAEMMAQLGCMYNPLSVLDPCCGIGNLLTHFSYIQDVIGIDTNSQIVEVAKYLNKKVKIECYDFLEYQFNRKFDLIIADLPIGARKRIGERSYSVEALFIEKSLSLLNNDGTFIFTVPDSFLSSAMYEQSRKFIIDEFSFSAVINLPTGTLPGTFIRTSVIVVRKTIKAPKVYMALFENNTKEIVENYKNHTGAFWIDSNKIHNRIDRHYFDPKYSEVEQELEGKNLKELSELAEIFRGYNIRSEERLESGDYLILSGRNIQENKIVKTDRDRYSNNIDNQRFRNSILRDGDIIVSLIFNDRKLYLYKSSDIPAIINPNCAIIRSRNNPYIKTYLSTARGIKLFESQADRKTTGTVIQYLTIDSLRKIKIPIIPIEDLNQLSLEKVYLNTSRENTELLTRLNEIETKISNHKVLEHLIAIKSIVTRIEAKVDKVLESLNKLQADFKQIKAEQRNDEEKLLLLYSALEKMISEFGADLKTEITIYRDLAERLIDNWDKLHELSKDFLPLAEYLYSKFDSLTDVDYSPVILQYCKTLENELLHKLFLLFTSETLKKYNDILSFLSADLSRDDNGEFRKTNRFATMIKKSKGKPLSEIKYTLGEMSFVLELTSSQNLISESPLLKEFHDFIHFQFSEEMVLSRIYLKEIKNIIDDFRNKCAHPYKLDKEAAHNCKNKIPLSINNLLNFLR